MKTRVCQQYCTPLEVPHELKLAIRRYKADSAITIEFSEFDALVELAVVNLNSVRCFPKKVGYGIYYVVVKQLREMSLWK